MFGPILELGIQGPCVSWIYQLGEVLLKCSYSMPGQYCSISPTAGTTFEENSRNWNIQLTQGILFFSNAYWDIFESNKSCWISTLKDPVYGRHVGDICPSRAVRRVSRIRILLLGHEPLGWQFNRIFSPKICPSIDPKTGPKCHLRKMHM